MARLPDFMNLDLGKLTWARWLVMLGTLAVFFAGFLLVGTAVKAVGGDLSGNRAVAMLAVFSGVPSAA